MVYCIYTISIMAESVVKLRVDSSEYDSKVKRAAQHIINFGDECRKAGQSVANADKETLEYVRSLGKMDTATRSARGKLSEMTTAFTELSAQYRHLTDEEKKSPFGQAMSKSLDELKGRIQTSRQELDDINGSLRSTNSESNSTGGMLDRLAGKFGLSGSAATKMGAALGIATAACKVAADAFMSNESQVDEWGRTVESGRSIYNSFLQALNSGNFGGFFSNMDNLIAKARAAYNAIDQLNTMMTIINPERAKLQAQQQELRSVIRREGANSAAGKEAQQKLEALEPQMQRAFREEARLNRNAFQARVEQRLAEGNIYLPQQGMDMLMRSFSDSQFAEQMMSRASGGITRTWHKGTGSTTATSAALGGSGFWEVSDTRNIYKRLSDLFTDKWRQENSPFLTAAYNAEGNAWGVALRNSRYLNSGGGGGRSGGGGGGRTTSTTPAAVAGSIDQQAQKVQALQKAWRAAADDDSRAKIKTQLEEAQAELDRMNGKVKAPEGSMKALTEELSRLQSEQQMVTTSAEWEAYNQRIKAVQQSMKDLRGEVTEMTTGFAGLTGNSMAAWISGQQSSLGNTEFGSDAYRSIAANIVDAKTLSNLLNTAIKNDITISPDTVEELWSRIIGSENIPDSVWAELEQTINTAIEDRLDIGAIKINVDTGDVVTAAKQTSSSWQEAARAVQSVSSALGQLEDPAAKVSGIVGQAIANIALGFAQATAASGKYGIFGWIAAIAGGLGTMISTISAIKSATAGSYAQGGIIPGNNFSGDQMLANVNSGEIILNRAQQSNIASQLTDTRADGGERQPYLDVETIWLGLGNLLKRRNMGEILTTKDLKRHGARL